MKAHFLILNDLFMTALSGQFFCLKKISSKYFQPFFGYIQANEENRKNFPKNFPHYPTFLESCPYPVNIRQKALMISSVIFR